MYYSIADKEAEKEFILDRFISKNTVILLTKEEFVRKYENYGGRMTYQGRELEKKLYNLKRLYFAEYKNKIVLVNDEFLKSRRSKKDYLEYLKANFYLDNIQYCIDNFDKLVVKIRRGKNIDV